MLTVNELFAGIGSQSAALERLGIDFKVVGIAEIDKDAMTSYASIHCDLEKNLKSYSFPTNKEMAQYLTDRNIGYDFKKKRPFNWFKGIINKITGKATRELKKYYLACILTKNKGDISKSEKLDYADFWTYSFPCQDISVAGKQRGINENTRSGLLYQVERLLEVSKQCGELPKYLMLENVKNLVGKKFRQQFDEWLQKLDELGFNTYWQVLNAKNYGIPQNRERVFAISIRKDIDTGYEFPKAFDNGKRLKDILEKEVDEKFYLSNDKVNLFMQQGNVNPSGHGMNGNVCTNDICNTLTTNKGEGPKIGIDKSVNSPKPIEYANCLTAREDRGISNHKSEGTAILETIVVGRTDIHQKGEIFSTAGLIRTLLSTDYKQPIQILEPVIGASRGRNPINPSDRTVGSPTEQRLEINQNGTSNTITTVQKDNYVVETSIPFVDKKYKQFQEENGYIPEMFNPYNCYEIKEFAPTQLAQGDSVTKSSTVLLNVNYRIRKLTPLECWRLMGFTDEQFYKAEKVNSNSQLYKQAGNSIVVDVLYYLFKSLFIERPTEKKIETQSELQGQMTIFEFIGV